MHADITSSGSTSDGREFVAGAERVLRRHPGDLSRQTPAMDSRSVRVASVYLLAIVVWTFVGAMVYVVCEDLIGSIITLIDPQVDRNDNPIAFLMLLAIPIGLLVPVCGFSLTIRWLVARFAPQANA